MIIRMLKELSENYSSRKTGIETIKKNQQKMKNTISEMKNTPEGINSRLDETEDQISDLGDKLSEHTQSEQQKEKSILKNDDI